MVAIRIKGKMKLELDPKKTTFQLIISKKEKNMQTKKNKAANKYQLRFLSRTSNSGIFQEMEERRLFSGIFLEKFKLF